jgi:phenylpropionate dioxygenase-like ring-hydroxylating dioxygenase large terminal subunit
MTLSDALAIDAGPGPLPRLTPRIHAAVLAGRGDHAPATMVVPNAHYTDPGIAARELATTFALPLAVGPSGMVADVGDYVTLRLVDTPVVVVRDPDGRARVFVNACRHRGAHVALGDGCTRRFTCPYHAWVFDTRGDLVGRPGAAGFDDRDPSELGLVELPSEERSGFIWARRDPDGRFDLDAHLGPMQAELDSWGLTYHVAAVMELELGSNWKCALEAFQETYHFPYVHRTSIVGQGTIADIATFDQFGRHHRLGVPLASMSREPELNAGENAVCIYYFHPATVIATSPIGGELLQFWPGHSPHSSRVRHTVLSRVPLSEPGMREFFADYTPLIQNVVRDEDAVVLETCGAGLAAGATDTVLGRNEIGCQAAHRQVFADLGITPTGD